MFQGYKLSQEEVRSHLKHPTKEEAEVNVFSRNSWAVVEICSVQDLLPPFYHHFVAKREES
jgi:hypothetical protein